MKEEINITSPEAVRCRAKIVPSAAFAACSLKIDFECWLGTKIKASDLETLITNESNRLESLVLDGVIVVGDFDAVTRALAKCKHLRSFDVFSCQLSVPTVPLLLGPTMAQLSRLEHICLSFSSTNITPWDSLTPVLQNPNHVLRILFLNGFDAPTVDDLHGNDQLRDFFAACGASKTLRQFTCLPLSNRSFTSATIVSVEKMIRRTTSLQVLKLSLAKKTSLSGVAEALRHNHSIQKLAIQGHHRPFSKIALQALYTTLEEHNFTLKELQMKLWETGNNTVRSKKLLATLGGIEFHLSLNRMGRAKLFSTSTKDWMDSIAALEGDLSAIFYFLKELNPSLFPTKARTLGTGDLCSQQVLAPTYAEVLGRGL